MQPFDGSNTKSIVIMDNCSIHHVEPVKELLQDAGILIFLPPYSPDYNPIEETFSSIKYYLKDHDEILQTLQAPDVMTIVKAAFDNVTAQDCNSWITDCGYAQCDYMKLIHTHLSQMQMGYIWAQDYLPLYTYTSHNKARGKSSKLLDITKNCMYPVVVGTALK